MRKSIASALLLLSALAGAQLLLLEPEEQEEARRKAQSAEPGGTLEKDLWQVLILLGVGENEPQAWDGEFAILDGELHSVEGYRFVPPDRILPEGKWRATTQAVTLMPLSTLAHDGVRAQQRRVVPKGGWMRGSGSSATRVKLRIRGQSFSIAPMELSIGENREFLSGRMKVRRVPPATDLSGTELRQHDFPALAGSTDGRLWAAWA